MLEYKRVAILCDDCKKHITDGYRFVIKCATCDREFSTKNALERHLKLVHSTAKPFACDWCTYSTNCRGSLKKHRKTVHYREYPHSCPYAGCLSSFSDEWNLVRHIDKVHVLEQPETSRRRKKASQHTMTTLSSVRAVKVESRVPPRKQKRATGKQRRLPTHPPDKVINIY
jgi:uncharacterized C2H2 Zn-finger protein